jgi:outer membrane protein
MSHKMKKLVKNLLVICAMVTTNSALANNYGADGYEDEGMLLFKVRGGYVGAQAKVNATPNSGSSKPGDLDSNGYSIDTGTSYFFTDNIATELSLGFSILKTKNSTLQKATSAYGNGTYTVVKRNNIYLIPAAAILQYHIAPFGGIRPYVGAGYHGSYLYTHSKIIKVKPGHGFVAQFGVDFVAKDDTFFTFDVKKYFLKSKVTFKRNMLYPNNSAASDFSTKVNYDPLVVSFGIGFKF